MTETEETDVPPAQHASMSMFPIPPLFSIYPTTCFPTCNTEVTPSPLTQLSRVSECTRAHQLLVYLQETEAPPISTGQTGIRAVIKACFSFSWCFNRNPHKILRMDENGGKALPPIWHYCSSGSQLVYPPNLTQWRSSGCKWAAIKNQRQTVMLNQHTTTSLNI